MIVLSYTKWRMFPFSIYINEYWVKLFAVWAKFFLLAANRELSIEGRRRVL